MPLKSRWSIDIPKCSLPTLIFTSATEPLSDSRPCFADAARADTHFLTPASFRLWCQRLAVGLQKAKHFNKGDRILLFSGNNLFFPVVFVGIQMAGGVFTGANPSFVARELAHQLKDSGAKYLLCADGCLDTGIEAAKLVDLPLERVFVFNPDVFDGTSTPETCAQKGCQYWGDLLASPEESASFEWDPLAGPGECDKLVALNYSSGTTGIPKGVEISHHNYVSNILQYRYLAQLHPQYDDRNKRARWLCFLPMYHAMAQMIFIGVALKRQIPVYLMGKFDFLQMLGHIQHFQITDLIMVPPIAVALVKHPAVKNFDLSSIEYISSGAAPLGWDVSTQVVNLWPKGKLSMKQGWGMTETTCSALGWSSVEFATSNSVGELNANCEGKIMSEDGQTEVTACGSHARGELWVRGPNIMRGYWQNPTATAEAITPDGWLKTGDVAYVDEVGKFFIVDRLKELIKVKGHQVAPAELEDLLLQHPAVADAAVIGVPTEDGEERPRAYVVLLADEQSRATKPEEIVEFIDDKVARYKRITGGVVWIDAVPKNPSGKILRRWLRDKAKEEMGGLNGGSRL